jgi:regulation of enolase protein 1 (concanavalin A-like superfamily)
MQHTILVHGDHEAVIVEQSPTAYTVTAYVRGEANVAWDTTTYAEAERWAKAVIEYPDEA